jgi:hypothetical protein
LRKLGYFLLGIEGNTIALVHSNGAAA